MALPPLEQGELPQGLHLCTLEEVEERFGTATARRQSLAQSLRRVLELALATGSVRRAILFGSFVTGKPEPNDVDVFLVMRVGFRLAECQLHARALFEHTLAQNHFNASVFWMTEAQASVVEMAIETWSWTREGTVRGIVEIVIEQEEAA